MYATAQLQQLQERLVPVAGMPCRQRGGNDDGDDSQRAPLIPLEVL